AQPEEEGGMKIGFCYESVLPSRGGCETYIADLARRLAAERHEVHLFACRWDELALPPGLHYHHLPPPRGPRFLRPWAFAAACRGARAGAARAIVSMVSDRRGGQDILSPRGGLHAAWGEHNVKKHGSRLLRGLARLVKAIDPAHRAFSLLEHRQYL